MRHVDEGTVHAWLDRQVTDPDEAAWITTHLRECATCSARVADEEATLRDAESLLASVAPFADASREAFDALVAARHSGGAPAETASGQGARGAATRGRWVTPVSWAAMIALAIGLGWTARQMTVSGGTSSPAPVATVAEQRESSSPPPPPATAPAPITAAAPPPPPPAPPTSVVPDGGVPGGQAEASSGFDPPVPPPVVYLPPALQQPPAPPEAQPATATAVDALASNPAVLAPADGLVSGVTAGRAGGAGRGGGGRGGGRGALLGLTGNGVRTDGQPVTERVDGIDWATMSRTDAAARSGMALYRIDGLIPLRTMVSADASKVRTVYLLNGAEVVLLQERPSPVLDQSQLPAADPSSWSSVRGDVVLTLRGAGGNVAVLGDRIRLD